VQARGRTLCDEAGTPVRLLGAAYDTTAVQEGEARVARVLESMSAAFFLLDRKWRFAYVNREAERFLGRTREELVGGDIWTLFPHSVDSDFEVNYRRAMNEGEPITFEAYYPDPLNAWYEVRALPGPDGLSVYFLDVTARRLAEEKARRVAERTALITEVTSELGGTLDAEEAVARLARLVVPALGDWCIVTLLDDEPGVPAWHRLRDIGWWHADPERRPLVERYAKVRLSSLNETSFLAKALTTGRPAVVTSDTTNAVAAVLQNDEARDLMRQLSPQSAAAVPLRANGRILGLLTVCHDAGSERQTLEDFDTALDVADRAALALDNARLYQQQRRISEGLQRSLLTAPPAPNHMQITVRYEPASQAAQVGGDWYDAFLQGDGSTMLVIGDVVGHDAEAAAAMGQIRGLLRGIAATTGDAPAGVLTRLDVAMALLQVDTTATAVVARVEQTVEERARGVTRLRWSNAGHPPPMAINPDGTVLVLSALAGIDSDLLLGFDPETPRTESEVTLERDATVLLYTDGLVERRGQSLDEGLAKLRDLLAELHACSLDDLCDTVLARMLPAEPEDDAALVAVRLHPQDRPRPAEAGPPAIPAGVPEEREP
jgi:PAS domain S-box-containing protein